MHVLRFFAVVNMKIAVLWDMTLYRAKDMY